MIIDLVAYLYQSQNNQACLHNISRIRVGVAFYVKSIVQLRSTFIM
jgi:hypothetical protein